MQMTSKDNIFLVTVVNEFLRLDPKMEVGLFYCRFYDVFPNIKS